MEKERDLLEKVLAEAEAGYAGAYRFLLEKYEENPGAYGPQTLYFLACLAGGAGLPEEALQWLEKAVCRHGWWYRPEVLEDDDLAALKDNAAFVSLKALSDKRYQAALSTAEAVFSRKEKSGDSLLIAVHGNTQNGEMAREDWAPFIQAHPRWQLETVQSGEPDGYGTYRWSYDRASCMPVAEAVMAMQKTSYECLAGGGFSAGCDMLLRAVAFTPARCDLLILKSPWIPVLQSDAEEVIHALREKNIKLDIRCGSEDEDCLPMAQQLHAAAQAAGIPSELTVQPGSRHQFPV